jgi:hypothetical protein
MVGEESWWLGVNLMLENLVAKESRDLKKGSGKE